MNTDTIIISSYPKSGNTMLTTSLNIAGKFDESKLLESEGKPLPNGYGYLRKGNKNQPNKLFEKKTYLVKTHFMWKPDINLNKLYQGKVIKVITIVRNPLDNFLSSINYVKLSFRNRWNNSNPANKNFIDFIDDYPLNQQTWDSWNLENLRDNGLLKKMFRNYIRLGCLPFVSDNYGTWFSHSRSYDFCKLPLLNLRYEDLINNQNNLESFKSYEKLSNFLCVNFDLLHQGVNLQNERANKRKKENTIYSNFFNKMTSNYWREYLDMNICKEFAAKYYQFIKMNGYSDLLDELFPGI